MANAALFDDIAVIVMGVDIETEELVRIEEELKEVPFILTKHVLNVFTGLNDTKTCV